MLELTLPEMSGFQVLTRLIPRAYHPQIPIIVFSHVDLPPPMNRLARNNGAYAYFLKSRLMQDELIKAISKAIAAAHKIGFFATTLRPGKNKSAPLAKPRLF